MWLWVCDCVTMWLWLCDCDYVIVWLWLCDYVIMWPCDCVYVIIWRCDYVTVNMWLYNGVTMWLGDYVIVWLCDCMTKWLCNYVTMWLFRLVAQRGSSYAHRTDTIGRCTPATRTLMTNINNVSETSGLTHYWSVQAPGKIPTQLPFSLTPSSLSYLTALQYIRWRHVSAVERVLRWPPASFKRPHPGPVITFYTYSPLSHGL